jgi:hypothetical protein
MVILDESMVSLTVPDDKKLLYQQPADGVAFLFPETGAFVIFTLHHLTIRRILPE